MITEILSIDRAETIRGIDAILSLDDTVAEGAARLRLQMRGIKNGTSLSDRKRGQARNDARLPLNSLFVPNSSWQVSALWLSVQKGQI